MLAQLLGTSECLVQSVSFMTTAGEVVDRIESRKPDVICISATPPVAVLHARHLCKQVRSRFPNVPVVVGLWNAQGDLSKVKTRIGGTKTYVVASLAEAQKQVRLLIQPILRRSDQQLPDSGPGILDGEVHGDCTDFCGEARENWPAPSSGTVSR